MTTFQHLFKHYFTVNFSVLQTNSKAQEFMSPNVWRKPEQKQASSVQVTSSAQVVDDSGSDDDCQIIAEEPGKPQHTGM